MMMHQKTITEKFADFICGLSFENLDDSDIYQLKTFFLDWLASAYAGKTQEPVKIIRELVSTMGGLPESTIILDNTKTSCLWAALVNGAASHMVEMDDLHRESILHPAAAIIPAVFAAGQKMHVSGKVLLTAIAAGYEVAIRIAMAAGPSHYRHWHTTGTCGTFGAAAGSAKILGLDETRCCWALGSAGTQASGLWEFLTENAMSKQLHPAKAAFNGLLAALLARKGFSGAKKILEGEKGFLMATSPDYQAEKCIAGLGSHFMFTANSLKYYASCGHTHAAIEATIKALENTPCAVSNIDTIHVRVYQAALDLLGNVKGDTPFGAKFNLPFCIATAARYKKAGIEDFSSERLNDSDLLALISRITIEGDETLSKSYPQKWPAIVDIRLKDGRTVSGMVEYPKGDPQNPLTAAELNDKFHTLTKGILDQNHSGKIIDRIMHLESVSDISDILEGVI